MSGDRRAGQRHLRRLVDAARRGGTLGSWRHGEGAGGYPGAVGADLDPDATDDGGGGGGTVTVGDRPKFIVGHPVLGALADPAEDSPWEV